MSTSKEQEVTLMKLYNVKNINGFFEAVRKCKGDVNARVNTQTINLKDNIVTYSNIFQTAASDAGIPVLDLSTEYAEDTAKLLAFAING